MRSCRLLRVEPIRADESTNEDDMSKPTLSASKIIKDAKLVFGK